MRPADESSVPASVQSSADDNRGASLQLAGPPTLHIHSFIHSNQQKQDAFPLQKRPAYFPQTERNSNVQRITFGLMIISVGGWWGGGDFGII